jgi:hypothetical protein
MLCCSLGQQLTPEGLGILGWPLRLCLLLRLNQLTAAITKVGNGEGVALAATQLALLRAAQQDLQPTNEPHKHRDKPWDLETNDKA